MTSWKVRRALIKAKLEPYLGFLHSVQYGKASLVCYFQELYRYLIDDFLIQYCQQLKKKDFAVKSESVSRKRKGKREYFNDVSLFLAYGNPDEKIYQREEKEGEEGILEQFQD